MFSQTSVNSLVNSVCSFPLTEKAGHAPGPRSTQVHPGRAVAGVNLHETEVEEGGQVQRDGGQYGRRLRGVEGEEKRWTALGGPASPSLQTQVGVVCT